MENFTRGLTESTRVSKSLVANVAYQGLFVAVNKHMLGESLFCRKTLVACWTNMRLVCKLVLAAGAKRSQPLRQLTANMCLHVPLDLASLWKPCSAGFAARTVVPAATEPLGPFLGVLDVGFRRMLE